MGLVIASVLSLGLGILALVGLLAIVRALIVERGHEADSTDDEVTTVTRDAGSASGRRCVMTP
jgi:hypothetical protein